MQFFHVIRMSSRIINHSNKASQLIVRALSSTGVPIGESSKNSPYDVIITGGGMVGTALAAALGSSPLQENKKILLLESGPQALLDKPSEKYSSRVCALSDATKELLSSFGAWDNILRFREVKHMRVWDSCSDVGISFDGQVSSATEQLAYIVENDVILSAILRQLLKTKAEVRYNSKVKNYNLNNCGGKINGTSNLPSITLDSGEILHGRLLVGADGVNSLLRKSANIHTIGLPYHQSAVVATVKISKDIVNDTAWQRFLPTGPIALLPLSDEFSCLIWTTSSSHSKELLKMNSETFIDSINHAFCSNDNFNETMATVGKSVENLLSTVGIGGTSVHQLPPTVLSFDIDSRKSFPLGLSHASHYVKERLALIGDAAHRVHPLSGQGVNLGFGDVTCLVKILNEAVLVGSDIGSLSNLVAYETERQRRVLPMMAAIDLLDRLYSSEFAPFVFVRSIGCQAANSISFIKDKMASFAAS